LRLSAAPPVASRLVVEFVLDTVRVSAGLIMP
jgi:hypothetical protein